MTGKNVLVTGATSGIGLEAACELAALGATVLVHGRTSQKAAAAAAHVRASAGDSGGSAIPVHADFGSLEQVRDLASQVEDAVDRLDVLVNNAGVYQREHAVSTDGYELTFAVNHLAGFLLTQELMALLCRSDAPRVITVSSVAHFKGTPDFGFVTGGDEYDAYNVYASSKLANVMFAAELADRLACTGGTSNSMHPGTIATKLLATGFPNSQGASVAEGAETIVYLASSPEAADISGEYFARGRPAHASPKSKDPEARAALWELSERLVARAGESYSA